MPSNPPKPGYHIPHIPHSTNIPTTPTNPNQPTPLQPAAPLDPAVVCTLVASPGANMTGTPASPDTRTSSGVSSGLFSASHELRFSLAGMLLVTEMGRSKMV